jgi:hypothetical protein
VSEKSITRQQLGLVGRRKSAVGTPQSRPRACSGAKFVVGESRREVSYPGWRSKSEIPDYGYFFKILKGQGPAAPLGEMDFVVRGVMIGGFALVAAPGGVWRNRSEKFQRQSGRRCLREGFWAGHPR